jgi:8-hydroxy-5-deazaflavin:NADPH oxidoreductase
MKIAILGTGNVGQTFAEKFIVLGHEVMIGTRNVADTTAREKYAEWQANNINVHLGTFNEAIAFGEIVLNVLKGDATLDVFASIDKAALGSKIIVDISNPLDFSKGFPPSLTEGLNNTNSLGEALQKEVPNAKVVKTLNTMWCGLMVNPAMIGGGNHQNFICGNNADAKATVIKLLNEFGWKNENILDLGDITNARGTEAVLPIWVRIYGATQNGAFNFAIVK